MERHEFDQNQPQGSMSLMNLRNTLRGLFQGDVMPLRPRASYILDDMEYPSDASAQVQWSGTGCTVGFSTTKEEGNYSLEVVIDGTGNRKVSKSQALDLSGFLSAKIWEQVDVASSAFQFYVKDGSSNESYWDLTSNGTPSTWQQDEIDLTSPDSNSGTPADLSDITEWGFIGLDASKTYLFDTIKSICGLNVAVQTSIVGNYYQNIYVGLTKIAYLGGSSPIITPPSANPRISLLVVSDANVLSWVDGAEASIPSEPEVPYDKIPICLVYCKTTMTKVVDYIDKDANPDEAYILKDVRPSFVRGDYREILSGVDASKPTTYILNRLYWATNTSKIYWDNGSAWVDITLLMIPLDTDGALTANSDTKIASQKATKTYADTKIEIPAGGANGDILIHNGTKYTRLPIGGANTVFTSNGTTPAWGAMASGGYSNMQVFTSNGTWVKPATTTRVYIVVVGGGAGGGAYLSSGYNGANSSFNSAGNLIIGAGGLLGNISVGGAGGITSNASFGFNGQNGGTGSNSCPFGLGGSSFLGYGALPKNINGSDGSGYGSGGSSSNNGIYGGGGGGGTALAIVPVSANCAVIVGAGGLGANYGGSFYGGNGSSGIVIVYWNE